MAKKKKSRFNSLSTPGNRQDLSNYLVELAFLRQNRGNPLPPKFWQQTRYKARYRREIMACRKFIKKYGEPFVLSVALKNYIRSWTDFARIEFLLQQKKESLERKASPKDSTPVEKEFSQESSDLRDFDIPQTKTKSLFERLKELQGGEEEERAS
jgi:hypothetical protein